MLQPSIDSRRLLGGALCLDFANSVDWERDGTERPLSADVLAEPGDLAGWGRRVGLLGAADTLPVDGGELARARRLRRAVHEAFAAVASGRLPGEKTIATLERTFAESAAAGRLHSQDGWDFAWQRDDPRRIRFAVAVSAVDLLRDPPKLARVRVCPGSNCGWLFLDTTGRRRWCSMEVCGSRAKMRRLYERRRATSQS